MYNSVNLLKSNQLFVDRFFFGLVVCVMLAGCSGKTTQNDQKEKEAAMDWVGTWSTSQQLTEPRNNPPDPPGLSGNTLRQIVHVSLGGEKLRLRLSNAFGTAPVVLNSVYFAKSIAGDSIATNTGLALTFEGDSSLTIPPGEAVLSDLFEFQLKPLSNVAITIHFDSINSDVTGHPGSRTTSYIQTGNLVSAASFSQFVTADHWYIIDAIDVMAPDTAAAVATLGDSITDGRGSGTNKQNRWPDELSKRLQAQGSTRHVAVLNQGIGGNCVLRPCLGPSALSRFETDVLNQAGVRWLIILEGVNDIGGIQTQEQADKVAEDIIAAYEEMITKAHGNDILVYGATVMPFGGSFYDRPASESARQQLNEWIRNSDKFDAVIDLDQALEDPKNPRHLLPEADDGDGLHPSETGHRMIAEAIDLALFTDINQKQ